MAVLEPAKLREAEAMGGPSSEPQTPLSAAEALQRMTE